MSHSAKYAYNDQIRLKRSSNQFFKSNSRLKRSKSQSDRYKRISHFFLHSFFRRGDLLPTLPSFFDFHFFLFLRFELLLPLLQHLLLLHALSQLPKCGRVFLRLSPQFCHALVKNIVFGIFL